ncbi:proteasome assembly chaperone family protein [Gryllotalpicola ginsengisoli]|uniref:proteasome assembly chaperone family protein n=1 Tax=Gryllotalpicola ginsengisoli TaxID=444608 RepID=UPI0003B7849A|nr:PAC2 family protein [Gryllotalpicola ginsengisoli]
MRNPRELYELTAAAMDVPAGLHLVAGLTGFADAGGAVSQLGAYTLENLGGYEVVATFDNDILLDYRARRPTLTFEQDHLTDYQPPRLALYLVSDEVGRPFLFLHGYEPDFEWEAFAQAILGFVDTFEIASVTWVHAIPMPVPHTRPLGVTVSGNNRALIEQLSVWRPRTKAPATAMHLIEHRLVEQGHSTAGLVVLVPHYLADTEYPAALITALQSIAAATGLIFPTDDVRADDRDFVKNIDEQVAGNAELERLVGALEQRHDSYMQDNPARQTDIANLPTADEIAAELEQFLAHQRRNGDDGQRG